MKKGRRCRHNIAMTAPITPTPHQQAALDRIQAALSPRRPTLLCGYAGTGKTTLAHWLAGELNHPLFLAPTNRAAWVLRSKLPPGARVQTIHSAAMQPLGSSHGEDIQLLEALVRCDGGPDKIVRYLRRAGGQIAPSRRGPS